MSDTRAIAMFSHMASQASPTGAEHSLALLARGLGARGHRVAVVVPGRWALEPGLRQAGVEVHVIPCRVCWLAYHDPVALPRAAAKWVRFALPDSGGAALKRFVDDWRPDIVHVNCLPHLRGARAGRLAGIPVVWHLREILPPGARRRWYASRLGRDASRVVAVSEAVAAWVRDEGLGDRVRVVHNGVESPETPEEKQRARAALALPVEGVTAGLFGQILPHKGVLEFVRAGVAALDLGGDLRFVVAGSGPESFLRHVRDTMASTPRPERFHLLPPQPDSRTLMAAADLVCLTTTTPDPFPRSVLEAMAASRPVVAFRSGGTPEMVDDPGTGRLVDVGDETGLARAMVELSRDESLRSALGRSAAARVEREFSLDRHIDRMEVVFSEVTA